MNEYLTEAVVLTKEPVGEQDARVTFYTKDLGKVVAKAISARKIASKLNAHLEPLNLVMARLVMKNGCRVVDVLTVKRFYNRDNPAAFLKLLNFVKEMTVEGESDYQLWAVLMSALRSGNISYGNLLRVLGFDPRHAACGGCAGQPDNFSVESLSFWCQNCWRREVAEKLKK